MSLKFPDTPTFRGFNAPFRTECDIYDLEVIEGEIPDAVQGTFYRLTHDHQYPPYHPGDVYPNGDGMISMWRFEDGHVDFKCRYVQTERYLNQKKTRRGLYGLYRNRYTNDAVIGMDVDLGTANTTPLWHGHKLFALKEDSHPYEVDKDTLETRGRYDFRGALTSRTFTAHPKLDYQTGECLFFGYQAKGDATTDLAYYVADKDGRIVHEAWLNAPYPGFVHDFGVTESHVIFPFFPLITELDVLKTGGPFYRWHGDQPTYFAVMPRRGTARDIKWFKGKASFAAHIMNAVTDGTKLVAEFALAERSSYPFFPNADGTPFDRSKGISRMTRLTFDLAGNTEDYSEEQLFHEFCEFPRTDDRYQMRPYRHGYFIYADSTRPTNVAASTLGVAYNSLGHMDHASGKVRSFYSGEMSGVGEPVFVPRSKEAGEAEGYLIVVVSRFSEMRSDVVILDAQNVEAGPMALIRMPMRLRPGAHGAWVSAEALRTGYYG